MSAVLFWDVEQNSEEWYRLRMAIPTASAMDKIITLTGKKSSQAEAYMNRLLWEYVSGFPLQEQENVYQSPWMQSGHENEGNTVKSFEFQTSLTCKKIGFISNWDGMIGASPDRAIMDGETLTGYLEIKSPAPYTQLGYLLDKPSLSKEYWPQLQAQMLIGETEVQYICSDSHRVNSEPVILQVNRDDKYCATLALYLREFVDTMLERRLRLKSEFGLQPPVREVKKALAYDDGGEFGVSLADLDAILGTKE